MTELHHLVRASKHLAVAIVLLAAVSSVATAQGRFVDVIVVLDSSFAPGGHAQNQAAAAQAANFLGVAANRLYGTALFGFSASISEGRLQGLRNDPRVAYVNLDQIDGLDAPPRCKDDPTGPGCGGGGGGEDPPPPDPGGEVTPWGISQIHAHNNTGDAVAVSEGAGIHVYVLDTGIDSDHGDLNVLDGHAAVACKGSKSVCKNPWDDDHGHGTHVAGTTAAVDSTSVDGGSGVYGVASEAMLHAVKVCSKSGSCARSAIIQGIDFILSQKVPLQAVVANMSIGGSGSKGVGTCTASGYNPMGGSPDAYYTAFCNAANDGVVFSVSAGNSGANAANSVPAAYYDAVITVSATDSNDAWPAWSNWGVPVALAAPGVSILSTWNDGATATLSGTSMASPHVAGTAALYLSIRLLAANSPLGYAAFTDTKADLETEALQYGSLPDATNHTEDHLDARDY